MTYEYPSKRRKRIRLELVRILGECWYCGFHLNAETATLDHLKPQCANGGEEFRNLRLSCRVCNRRKQDRPLEAIVVGRRRGQGVYYDNATQHYRQRIGAE